MPEFGINSGDAGNRRGINFWVGKHQCMTYWSTICVNTGLAAKYSMQIPNIKLKVCKYVCLLKHNIRPISYGWILACIFWRVWDTTVFGVYPFCICAWSIGCKILCANRQHGAQTSSITVVYKFKMLKLDQFLVCFQNFGQGAFFRAGKMFIHVHSAYMHTSVSWKSCGRTPKNAYTTGKTVLDVTSSSQNSRISCLCSIV